MHPFSEKLYARPFSKIGKEVEKATGPIIRIFLTLFFHICDKKTCMQPGMNHNLMIEDIIIDPEPTDWVTPYQSF